MLKEVSIDATARYSINETCALLGIERTTLWRHTNSGYIKSYLHKISGKKFYRGADIIKYRNAIC